MRDLSDTSGIGRNWTKIHELFPEPCNLGARCKISQTLQVFGATGLRFMRWKYVYTCVLKHNAPSG